MKYDHENIAIKKFEGGEGVYSMIYQIMNIACHKIMYIYILC